MAPERRASTTATVLFTDLVASTELMARLGDAAFDDLRRAHFAGLREVFAAHGGEEIKNTGDGVMVVFGSVADAIRGAVAMQHATDRHARSGSCPLAIRIGLSVGDVTFEDGDVFGGPVVEAARLVATADPGKILTTGIARALAGGRTEAEFVDLGPMEFKGLPDPVPVCEVFWQPVEASVPIPALLTDVGRVFVGRGGEVERLERLWKEICQLPLEQRSALLLNLRDPQESSMITLLSDIGIATVREVASVLTLPLEGFAGLWNDLPLDDSTIAQHLQVTRQQVINFRVSARRRLSRRMRGLGRPF